MELEAEGWIRQFIIEAERADEYVELHESLGNEVRVLQVSPETLPAEECTECIMAAPDRFVVIYTRPREI